MVEMHVCLTTGEMGREEKSPAFHPVISILAPQSQWDGARYGEEGLAVTIALLLLPLCPLLHPFSGEKPPVILKEISSLLSLNLTGGLSFSNGHFVLNIIRELSPAGVFGGMDDAQRPASVFWPVALECGAWPALGPNWSHFVVQTDFQPGYLGASISLCHFWVPSCRCLVSVDELYFMILVSLLYVLWLQCLEVNFRPVVLSDTSGPPSLVFVTLILCYCCFCLITQ